MSGVIDENGVQWQHCHICRGWVRIQDLLYEEPSDAHPYGRDIGPCCKSKANNAQRPTTTYRLDLTTGVTTMTTNRIDRDVLRQLRTDIDAALAAVGAKHKVTISCGGATFDDLQATFKLQVKVADPGALATQARDDFERWAPAIGLEPEWYGAEIVLHDKVYEVVGVAPGRSKNSVKIRRRYDGKGFVCSPEVVRAQLHTPTPAKKTAHKRSR